MKKIISYFLLLFFLSIFIFSSYKIISYLKGNYDNKKIQKAINSKIKIIPADSKDEKSNATYKIDFATLKKENPDTVGYLEVRGTNINYIAVQAKDNEYYLKHNYNKDWNVSGWIFVDYRNQLKGEDKNIVIYGHSIRDGSMFGTLKNSFTEKWRENTDNLKIVFVTEQGTFYYQVFSTYEIIPEDYYIKTDFKNEKEYDDFLKKIQSRSNYDYSIDVHSEDKILTLSTCNATGSKRVVLHAKLMNSIGEENE